MRRLLWVFTCLALTLIPLRAEAARFSGAYLLQLCDMDGKGREKLKGGHIACQAYIGGVIDYHNVLQSLKIAPSVDICIPQETGSQELHAVVLAFLLRHTEHDSFVAAPAVTMALYEAYPCE